MTRNDWRGVMPAITTPFNRDFGIDFDFVRKHIQLLESSGCTAIVTPGSLGEGATLDLAEKASLWRTCVESVRIPIIAAIASASTADAIRIAREAERCGCRGLMVLPPYLYKGAWRETRTHFSEIIRATNLSCMLYNNPIAYGVDVQPEQVADLAAAHPNLHAVKESSADVRRITSLRAILKDRLALFIGVDDLIVEGIAAGATGWIAGLVNALPRESIDLFNFAMRAEYDRAHTLYSWFLPLLRMDATYDFVQLIKLVQAEVGLIGSGGPIVRGPRMLPEGDELNRVQAIIRHALKSKP